MWLGPQRDSQKTAEVLLLSILHPICSSVAVQISLNTKNLNPESNKQTIQKTNSKFPTKDSNIRCGWVLRETHKKQLKCFYFPSCILSAAVLLCRYLSILVGLSTAAI